MTIDHSTIATLLDIVDKGEAKLSTRAVDIRFSHRRAGTGMTVLEMLNELAYERLVNRHVEPGNPIDRWEITDSGRQWLEREATSS